MTDAPTTTRIRPKDRDAVLQSLRAGVVPRTGLQHIAVGRPDEINSLIKDIARIADGGSGCRFIIGDYGSGKTFFLQLIRSIALQRSLLTVHADLAPDRRLQATGGQARSLFAELMRNIATRGQQDGGAMTNVVEKFVGTAMSEARREGTDTETVIRVKLAKLSELVGGYDFADVIAAYWRGHESGNEQLRADAVRWLRGEFSTRTDARTALGVRSIVDDSQFYDQLKLMARFAQLAGFHGLLVCLDEMVNLYKLANAQARNSNYEQILRILNDSMQGSAEHLGFLFGGTPDFLLDPRRGLYSYQALQSRLAENTFAVDGLKDFSGPVLRLASLTQEDFFQLLKNLRHVQAGGNPDGYLLPDDALVAFMRHCSERIGEACFRTPRTTIRSFLDLLAVLEQNPGTDWTHLIDAVVVEKDIDPALVDGAATGSNDSDDNELSDFSL
ncbi:ATP-binding protein [Pseudonocardia sp. H11422]|uniref:ATP-binding protein n=1 Tax=Pseudonocardia sp. H11422 TaxID=2835866 RepID=UPI001BDD1B6A|nr:ATP-binding protein [Pseudonocardia sp. H11422]